jgi:hypothetical protein
MSRDFPTARERAAYALGRQEAAASGEPLTLARIKAMSAEEVADRLPEVNEVLAKSDQGADDE